MMHKTVFSLLCSLVVCSAQGAAVHSKKIEEGGAGPYKAIVVEESSLPDFTIVRPEKIKAVAAIEGPLPVLIFGNGACNRDTEFFLKFLTHISSYGYVVVSNGIWDGARVATARTDEEKKAEIEEVYRSLSWLKEQNGKKKSDYYQCVDVNNIGVMGQSCGGLQALYLASFGDERIRAVLALNSGLFVEETGRKSFIRKEDLSRLSVPVMYMVGGASDMAYPNAVDDFRRIDKVPVVFASSDVGHNGTYRQAGGGKMAILARMWFDYLLKGKKEYEANFRFAQLPDEGFDDWYITSKNFSHNETIVLAEAEGEDLEHIDYDEFGHVHTIHAVCSPGIEVFRPAEGKENGTSVMVFPGGALMNLAWETELHDVANFLNARGVTVFGIKYRTRSKGRDPDIADKAASDAIAAMRYIKAHASEWNIDPEKIGWMGFSAGGMVENTALMKQAAPEDMPFFLCSIYGPVLGDIVVPPNAPKLFVSVHADHPNVFQLCQTLFSEWKAAGLDAEMHIWGYNTGGLFCLGKKDPDKNTVRGTWKESLFAWLISNNFITGMQPNPVLEIEGGKVQGVQLPGTHIYAYRGIPYAAPPVGALRWKAPQDVVPWRGVLQADEFGHPAWQAPHAPGGYTPEFFFDGDPEFSEDCLDLNIWTPAPGKTEAKLPVAMWIHGGGYNAGWSFEPEMDGLEWAKQGVVLVSVNYRLGLLGFLTHPALMEENPEGVSGNYGMLDQVKALHWIRDNIARFGGDPDNVTIIGQSAGAASVQTLAVSPLARGLFHKVIIQSGRNITRERDNTAGDDMKETSLSGKKLMDWAGCETLNEMRALEASRLVSLTADYRKATGERLRPATAPVLDGYALPEKFSTAVFAGRIADVPYMVGYTDGDPDNCREGAIAFAEERAKTDSPAFVYRFSRALPTDGRPNVLSGAFHSSELWYTFGSMRYCWRPFTAGDYALSRRMVACWTNFIKYGNPNGKNGKGSWSAYTEDSPMTMVFRLDESGLEEMSGME